MISFRDTLQTQQQAPSAQMKQPQPAPNLLQQGMKAMGDFANKAKDVLLKQPVRETSQQFNTFVDKTTKPLREAVKPITDKIVSGAHFIGQNIGNAPFGGTLINPPLKLPTNLDMAKIVGGGETPATKFLSGKAEEAPKQLATNLDKSYGSPKAKETQEEYLRREVNTTVSSMNIGGFTKPVYDKAAKYLNKVADKASIQKIMDFIIDVQKTGGKKNYGQLGQEMQAIATDVFGKNARNLTNKQLANAFDATLKSIGQIKNKFSFGLATDNIRDGEIREDPISKVIIALKQAKPLRAEQEAVYTQERLNRIAKADEAFIEAGGGQAGHEAKLEQLRGALAEPQQFEGLAHKLDDQEIDHLHNMINENPVISPYEKIAAGTALNKVLTGRVPQEAEFKLLKEVFGEEFDVPKSGLDKAIEVAADVGNLPRSLMSTADVSAPFRQGVFAAARHPKEFAKAFVNQFKYFASDKAFMESGQEILRRPNYPKMREYGLELTTPNATLSKREEEFMSSLAEKIPLFGSVVKASSRAYTGFLNRFRADIFDKMVDSAEQLGKADDPKFLKDMTEFINNATGRGNLANIPVVGKPLQQSAPLLNGLFFSPRLMASRFNLLNPVYYAKLEPTVRKEALKTLATFTTTGMTILGLVKLMGADVGTDPRSADFGKIKIGNTRYDIWGGFQQYVRLMAQLITGESVNSTTGKVYKFGQGYKPTTRKDIVERFFESKNAPLFSLYNDIMRGTDALGEPVDYTNPNPFDNPIGKRMLPFILQDMRDTINEYGAWGPIVSMPGLFGVGSQTYGGNEKPKGLKTRSSTRTRKGVGTRILP